MIAPLQLLDYRSELLTYERLDPEPIPDDVDAGVGVGIELETTFDKERNARCVHLTVAFNADDELPEAMRPYVMHRGRLRVTGWLTWIDEEVAARDDAERLLLVNGLSMLFGIARVHISDLTSTSRRRLVLPSITFKPIVEEFLRGDRESTLEPS
ncbi:hypothetical protein [Salisaeta longa]|uniref:hypothetical protein n=1 Tax=Salisaeta longa TaxID=503170 RepID=UPI0003B3E6C4|nr:hypothetical protein [Salisaeta longa]